MSGTLAAFVDRAIGGATAGAFLTGSNVNDSGTATRAADFQARAREYRLADLPGYAEWSERKRRRTPEAVMAQLDVTWVRLLPEDVEKIEEEFFDEVLAARESALAGVARPGSGPDCEKVTFAERIARRRYPYQWLFEWFGPHPVMQVLAAVAIGAVIGGIGALKAHATFSDSLLFIGIGAGIGLISGAILALTDTDKRLGPKRPILSLAAGIVLAIIAAVAICIALMYYMH